VETGSTASEKIARAKVKMELKSWGRGLQALQR
jgi:hypothetical protein